VADSWLHEAVCRQGPELWVTVGYMKLCVDRFLNVGESWLHETVCRHILWPTFGSSIVTVFEVTERSVSSSLWRKVEQQSIAVLHTRQCHCGAASLQTV
jgi:hypothetical protein